MERSVHGEYARKRPCFVERNLTLCSLLSPRVGPLAHDVSSTVGFIARIASTIATMAVLQTSMRGQTTTTKA